MNAFKRIALFCMGCLFGLNLAQAQQYEENALYVKLKENTKVSAKSFGDRRIVPLASLGLRITQAKSDQFGLHQEASSMHLFDNPVLEKTFLIQFDSIEKIDKLIRALEKDPLVEYVERVSIGEIYGVFFEPKATPTEFDSVPDDTFYQTENGLELQWYLDMINAPAAWHMQKAKPEIIAAVIDGAVWGEHPELQIPSVLQYATNGGSSSAPPASNQDELCGAMSNEAGEDLCTPYTWSHGTHCAGIIGARTNNGEGMASLSAGVTLMGISANRPSTPGAIYRGYDGITWAAENGARVINCSWGGARSSTENSILKSCYDRNIVILGAAGNQSSNTPTYPAASQYVISVGSVDENGRKSSFSNYGPWVDIAAPGGFANKENQGIGIISSTWCYPQYMRLSFKDVYENNGFEGQRYDIMVGTSMATPVVASLCALMLSRDSTLTPDEIRDILQTSSKPTPSTSNSFTPLSGIIDAAAALKAVDSARFDAPVSNLKIADTHVDTAWLEWDAPSNPEHEIIGYNIYVNGILVDSTVSPDATGYTAIGGEGGMTTYMVSVNYEDRYKSPRKVIKTKLPSIFNISILCMPNEGGTVTGGGKYEEFEIARLQAYPNPGFEFSRWRIPGGSSSTRDYYDVEVREDMNITAVFSEITSTEQVAEQSITITPNPVTDVLTIKATAEMESIVIFDYQGRKIQEANGNRQLETILDLGTLPTGNYILDIQTSQGNVQKKFVKM